MNTALNRTGVVFLTNESGGDVAQGDVVIVDDANAGSFTTTTTGGFSDSQVGVVLDVNGIANNATGAVAFSGWVPVINLDGAASLGDFVQTDTVAGQGTPHAAPQDEGDFAQVLAASATPAAILFGSPNGASGGGGGNVNAGGTLTSNAVVIGQGSTDVAVLASLGTAGHVLTSAGAGSPPSFAVSSGRFLGRQIITATGAGTYTPTSGTASVVIELQGAGGGGSGVQSPTGSNIAIGRGGGGGGWISVRLTSAFSGASYSVGAKGTGGAAGNNAGNTGGDTVFTATGGGGTVYTAGGGTGGTAPGTTTAVSLGIGGGNGGTCTNGDIQMPGLHGGVAIAASTSSAYSGSGGNSRYSVGALGSTCGTNASTAGVAATGKGGGGSGAVAAGSGAQQAGGDGSDGLIIFWEYS